MDFQKEVMMVWMMGPEKDKQMALKLEFQLEYYLASLMVSKLAF